MCASSTMCQRFNYQAARSTRRSYNEHTLAVLLAELQVRLGARSIHQAIVLDLHGVNRSRSMMGRRQFSARRVRNHGHPRTNSVPTQPCAGERHKYEHDERAHHGNDRDQPNRYVADVTASQAAGTALSALEVLSTLLGCRQAELCKLRGVHQSTPGR